MKKIYFSVVMFLINTTLTAQVEAQQWTSVEVNATVAPKTQLELGYLKAYSITEKFSPVFSQARLAIDRQVSKRINVEGGLNVLSPINNDGNRLRAYLRVAHNQKLGSYLRWTNAVRLETNSKAETRFRQRIILNTRIAARKRITALNLLPFASYSLFYNIGGNPIRYYDSESVEIARQSPDGFHRGRLSFGANAKITKVTRISLSYTMQREFNLGTASTRKMNVYDPVRNRILRPFNDFNAVQLNFEFDLNKIN